MNEFTRVLRNLRTLRNLTRELTISQLESAVEKLQEIIKEKYETAALKNIKNYLNKTVLLRLIWLKF